MRYESHTCYACLIIKLVYLVRMDHNSMDPNPKYATSRWDSLAKTYKIVINRIFMMKNVSDIQKNKTPHIFTPPRPLGSGGVKIWGVLFFFKYRSNWTQRFYHNLRVCKPKCHDVFYKLLVKPDS